MRDFSEAIDAPEELCLVTANGQDIPFIGWIEVTFRLMLDERKNRELIIPMLVWLYRRIAVDHLAERHYPHHPYLAVSTSPPVQRDERLPTQSHCPGMGSEIKLTVFLTCNLCPKKGWQFMVVNRLPGI